MTSDYYQMGLSDGAFEYLVALARQAEWVRMDKAKGLGPFMSALLATNPTSEHWEDTRPYYMREAALEELESGHFSEWDNGEYRISRYLLFPLTSRAVTAQLARALGVVRSRHKAKLSDAALISEFWEAVGLTYLTPVSTPPPSPYKTKKPSTSRRIKHELDW